MIKLIIASAILAPIIFRVADMERGYNALGGEIFIFLLPVLVMWLKEMIEDLRNGGEQQ